MDRNRNLKESLRIFFSKPIYTILVLGEGHNFFYFTEGRARIF